MKDVNGEALFKYHYFQVHNPPQVEELCPSSVQTLNGVREQ